jgi:predicted N-acyltransferase
LIKKSFPENFKNFEENPFSSSVFYRSLEKSQCVGAKTGWNPLHFLKNDAVLPGYIKEHSYGEYIFDWSWANFYEQLGEPYYPKLIHMTPFSPVNSPKFLNATDSEKFDLAKESFEFYQSSSLTGEHYLFTDEDEKRILSTLGFSHLKSMQYHFKNIYTSFDHFLSSLKPSRRKMIRKERRKLAESELNIECFTGDMVTAQLLEKFYGFYIATISKKQSFPYLNREFFKSLLMLGENKLVVYSASLNEDTVAMALFFEGKDTLFGRYWGIRPEFENQFPGLHFELCYYQGIDYCIDNKLSLFEAGAQGEHKLWRGFEPVQINSFHHIKSPELYEIIKNDILRQNQLNDQYLTKLRSYLPYK